MVAYEENGSAFLCHLAHLSQAFPLKRSIAYGQNFIHEQNFRVEMRGDGESEAHVHAAGVMFHGGVDEFVDFGKGDDLVKLPIDLDTLHSQNRAVQENILAAG